MSDDADTTSVQTDDTSADDSTVLTGDDGVVDTSTNTNTDAVADVAAAQAILDAGDDSSAEDKAAAQAIVDAAANTDGEGSDLPPDTYADFVMPEGVQLDETALAAADPLFKELGLTQENAQKVVDLYASQVQAGSLKQVETFNQLKSDWLDQSKNDKEFGGDKFDENVKVAQLAITKHGTPELKELMESHGVGNHPEMIRFMVRVGRTLSEDVPGSTGAATSSAQVIIAFQSGSPVTKILRFPAVVDTAIATPCNIPALVSIT